MHTAVECFAGIAT